MKLRELVEKHAPEAVSTDAFGGVWDCPDQYDFIKNSEHYTDPCCKNCTECWNQEYREDE